MTFMHHSLSEIWKVLLIFLIPFGGGIPAGVLLGKNLAFTWQLTTLLYILSDLILACLFEPLMWLFVVMIRRPRFHFAKGIHSALRKTVYMTIAHFGHRTGPLALILISFGADPMTGRSAAGIAGHGFITGWSLAIAGDMIFFAILMASTLWLANILGDGQTTVFVILAAMILAPVIIRRTKSAISQRRQQSRQR